MVDINTLLVQSFSEADFYEALGRAAGNKTEKKSQTPGSGTEHRHYNQHVESQKFKNFRDDREVYKSISLLLTTKYYADFQKSNGALISLVSVQSDTTTAETTVVTHETSCVSPTFPQDESGADDCYDRDSTKVESSKSHNVTFSFTYTYKDTKGTHTEGYKLVVNPERNEIKDSIDLLCPTQTPCQNYGGLTEEAAVLGIREYLGLDNTKLIADIAKAKEEERQKARPTLFEQ